MLANARAHSCTHTQRPASVRKSGMGPYFCFMGANLHIRPSPHPCGCDPVTHLQQHVLRPVTSTLLTSDQLVCKSTDSTTAQMSLKLTVRKHCDDSIGLLFLIFFCAFLLKNAKPSQVRLSLQGRTPMLTTPPENRLLFFGHFILSRCSGRAYIQDPPPKRKIPEASQLSTRGSWE